MEKKDLLIDASTCVVSNYTGMLLQLQGDGSWADVLASATDYTDKEIATGMFDPTLPNATYLMISMPCGGCIKFKSKLDVLNLEPEKDIPCTCGDPTHYFIRWRKYD